MKKLTIGMLLVLLLTVMPGNILAQDNFDGTIAELVIDFTPSEFNTLLFAVQNADPAVLGLLLNDDIQLTVFAPTDAAFAALGDTLNAVVANQECLTYVLSYHVAEGRRNSKAVVNRRQMVMLTDDKAFIERNGGNVSIAGATIIGTDNFTSNGVVHVIDAVMIPPRLNEVCGF